MPDLAANASLRAWGEEQVRAEPFGAVELELAALWEGVETEPDAG